MQSETEFIIWDNEHPPRLFHRQLPPNGVLRQLRFELPEGSEIEFRNGCPDQLSYVLTQFEFSESSGGGHMLYWKIR